MLHAQQVSFWSTLEHLEFLNFCALPPVTDRQEVNSFTYTKTHKTMLTDRNTHTGMLICISRYTHI